MNGSELRSRVAELVSETHGVKKKDAAAVLDTLHDVVKKHLAQKDTVVSLLGLGTLESVTMPPRKCFDGLGTKEFYMSDAKRKVKFSPSAGLNRAVRGEGSAQAA